MKERLHGGEQEGQGGWKDMGDGGRMKKDGKRNKRVQGPI